MKNKNEVASCFLQLGQNKQPGNRLTERKCIFKVVLHATNSV